MSMNLYWNSEVALPVGLFPKQLQSFVKKINDDKPDGIYKHICKLIFTNNIVLITYKEQEEVLEYIQSSDAIKVLLGIENKPVILSDGYEATTEDMLLMKLKSSKDKRYCPYRFT